MTTRRHAIGLSMIVKNESRVIVRCLDSVRPLVDYVMIADTGSTDGTQRLILDWVTKEGIPGQVLEEPWQNFAYNRSHALAELRQVAAIDYALVIDADDVLVFDADFDPASFKAAMHHDLYDAEIRHGGSTFFRPQILRNSLAFSYKAVLHEYLEAPNVPIARITAKGFHFEVGRGGARSENPKKYQDDAIVLQDILHTETDTFLISRYTFYLAQSYRDCGDAEQALAAYLKRAGLGFWDEEVFESLYEAAKLKEALGHAPDEVLAVYTKASDIMPRRAEALHGASRFCRMQGRNREGFELAKRGLQIGMPSGGLFVQRWIYEYGLRDEFAINAYWSGEHRESLDACITLLASPMLPASERERVGANARFAADKCPRAPDLGVLGRTSLLDLHAIAPDRPRHSNPTATPRIMMAILVKQKAKALPLYLRCLEALDYPKSEIVLYVRTNNNTDETESILRDWIARVGGLYAAVEFDTADVAAPVEAFAEHEWNAMRFRVLGHIRNVSLRRALEHDCRFYFVADADNFIRASTLRELVALNLPIVAPLLRSIHAGTYYANYHAEIDANGYYKNCDQYHWLLNGYIRGVAEVPVVHCTYLIRSDVLIDLTYQDATERHEYVIFSDSARKANIPQYLDNRQTYGYITFGADDSHHVTDGIERAAALLQIGQAGPDVSDARLAIPRASTNRSSSTDASPRTLLFCTSYAASERQWSGRYQRWLKAIRSSSLRYDAILLVDDGSPTLPDWPGANIFTDDDGTIIQNGSSPLMMFHFRNHLGRKATFDFPGWYRSFAFAGRFAAAAGFEKIIHIESDAFLIGSRVQHHFNQITAGWTALWCPLYGGYAESGLQVIAGDAVKRFAMLEQSHPHDHLIGKEFERQLPFDIVETRFKGSRYGEYLNFVPGNAEYVVSAKDEQPEDYYWWLNAASQDSA